MIEFKKIILFLSGSYILSLSLHYWDIKSIRISEIVFLLLFFTFLYGIIKKHIFVKITKIDLITGLFLAGNIIILLTYNNNFTGILSTAFSLYLFLIYYIFKNIFNTYGLVTILKFIITLTLFTALLGILGWILYQINIDNILANERDYPITLGKSVQSVALYTTPNLLTFSLIIGILILLKSEIKNKIKLILFIVFNIALFFTFSKSLLIYFGLIILLFSSKVVNKYIKNILIFSSIFIFIIQIFLTNFLILQKSNDNLWVNEKYTHPEVKPVYENINIKIIKTNYYFLKEKSYYLIKENFFTGIGFDNFKNKNIKYPILNNQKPHSTYFGIFSEFGVMGFISIVFLLIYNLNISIKNKEYYMSLIIIYLIIEGINADIVSLKLTWIIFAINNYMKNKKN